MPLSRLTLSTYGPFKTLDLELNPDINLFIGLNNTGKTAALCAIAEIAVYPFSLPRHFLHGKRSRASLSHRAERGKVLTHSSPLPISVRVSKNHKRYQDFLRAIGYSAFLPALRVSTDFRSAGPTQQNANRHRRPPDSSTSGSDGIEDAELFFDTPEEHSFGESSFPDHAENPTSEPEFFKRRQLLVTNARYVRDQDAIQRIIDLDYRFYRNNDRSIRAAMDSIAEVTSEITRGFHMRFVGVREDRRGLYIAIQTPYGEVPLNTLSQGTQSVFQWVSRLVIGLAAYSHTGAADIKKQRGVVLIDEVDAHLHPTWQRQVLPTLKSHFQNLQVVCTAHSPLMIAGLKTGQVHLFGRAASGAVTVTRNEADVVGWTSDQVYQEFLGVENPTDLETADATTRLADLRSKARLTPKDKDELARLGQQIKRAALDSPSLKLREPSPTVRTRSSTVRRQFRRRK